MQRAHKLLAIVNSRIYHSKRRIHKVLPAFMKLSEEVQQSVLNGSPVVALESTVITHGLPYPQNISTACKLEGIVRQNNAVPATIGIINGIIHVGLNSEQLETLASPKGKNIKVSRRDLPYMISKQLSGGTTVAATMLIAHKAGIPIFATGGIGGVHRGAEKSMDISADLYELSRTPVTVISAGVKSILDIGLTLEYLESLGVCIATFGSSKEFPSFFTPASGFSSPCNVETYTEAAHLIDCRDQLQLKSGLLLAAPIPEQYSNDDLQTDKVISEALSKAVENNIKGKDVTPFVLSQVHELSAGASLRANIGLLENNAAIGSRIACELCKLKNTSPIVPTSSESLKSSSFPSSSPRPVVIGGSILDIHVKAAEEIQMDGKTIRGCVQNIAGGVGRNIADCLSRLQMNPLLLSVVGAQEYHATLLDKMQHMDHSGIHVVPEARTATCVVLLDHTGECQSMIGDMGVHGHLQPPQVEVHRQSIATAPLVVMDCNTPFNTMEYILDICSEHQVPVWLEPTDISLAGRMFQRGSKWRSSLSYASPNLKELKVMHSAILGHQPPPALGSCLEDVLTYAGLLGKPLLTGSFHTLLVTLGSQGVALVTALDPESPFPIRGSTVSKSEVRILHYPAPSVGDIISVSGAGDCFAAGMITGILQRLSLSKCIEAGKRAAALSLYSHLAVPHTMCLEKILSP